MTTNGAASESRWSQLAPLSGAIFIGMYVVAMLLIASYEFLPSPDEAVSFFEDNSGNIGIGGYIATWRRSNRARAGFRPSRSEAGLPPAR